MAAGLVGGSWEAPPGSAHHHNAAPCGLRGWSTGADQGQRKPWTLFKLGPARKLLLLERHPDVLRKLSVYSNLPWKVAWWPSNPCLNMGWDY